MPTLRRLLLSLTLTVLIMSGLVAPPQPALAASGYSLTAGGARTTTSGTAIKLTTTFTRNAKAVKKATALLQYLKGTHWVTEKKVAIRSGKGAVSVKHGVGERTYRFTVKGKDSSDKFIVHFVPATFTISGSGSGHGVGMSQYGAYRQARDRRTAPEILGYYYPGAVVGAAVNNPRAVKVQVLGPPADRLSTAKLSISAGGFTVTGGTPASASTAAGKPITLGVSGSRATAKVTLASGKAAVLTGPRLTFAWSSTATASMTGAQGTYRYGNLQATVIGSRLNLINELKMNTEYLYGIDEMPSSWGSAAGNGLEALKAQAIAARSYVITRALGWNGSAGGVNPACDCQVFDDSRSQNFTGWKKAGAAGNAYWRKAVDDTMTPTTVQVLRPSVGSGQIAEALYFASSGQYTVGGITYSGTAANRDVFGSTPISYLSHVADPYSASAPGNPYRTWTRPISQAKLAKLFDLGPLRSVQVTERYPGGLVKSLTAINATGRTQTRTRTAEGWRTSLGLPGAWIAAVKGR
ncbi:MAG: SpoIID/LytB domain-containing protein [Propionicimonas sp.]